MGRWAGPKYPEGPPANYDPENPHADPVALLEHREYEVRRKEVGVAKAQVRLHLNSNEPPYSAKVCFNGLVNAQILRERVRMCYIKEGVNHIQNCKQVWSQCIFVATRGCAKHEGKFLVIPYICCLQLAEQYLDSIKVRQDIILFCVVVMRSKVDNHGCCLQNVGIHRQNAGMYERRGAQSETE